MYLLTEEDGSVKQVDILPKAISWDCWPKAIKIELYHGPDVSAFKLTQDGWVELEDEELDNVS